jgi:hypothetical protein
MTPIDLLRSIVKATRGAPALTLEDGEAYKAVPAALAAQVEEALRLTPPHRTAAVDDILEELEFAVDRYVTVLQAGVPDAQHAIARSRVVTLAMCLIDAARRAADTPDGSAASPRTL